MNEKSTLLNQLRIDRTGSAPPPARRPVVLWGAIGGIVVVAALAASWFAFASSGEVPVHAVIAKAIAHRRHPGGGGSHSSSTPPAMSRPVSRW